MKKLLLIVSCIMMITACTYNPDSLLYGETRHGELKSGRYIAQIGNLLYELKIQGSHEHEANVILTIYKEDPITEEKSPFVELNGKYRHEDRVKSAGYWGGYDFNSYHIDELLFEDGERVEPGYEAEDFNGLIRVEIVRNPDIDDEDYINSAKWDVKVGTILHLVPVDYYPYDEVIRDLPLVWVCQDLD